ncbi:MAG: hypothetical protein OXB91_08170, partial [Bryobacterales bacterium]|nr:hypothetical protein [Bryobacterales bacterium]
MTTIHKCIPALLCCALFWACDSGGSASSEPAQKESPPYLVQYEGGEGAGQGKHIVLIGGDEEYRSEEGLPQLARMLSQHHGFRCTVLFAVDPETGIVNPHVNTNIP